ncbi:hypothetical protein CPAR01_08835 [Colletotrichum paranaense]|uniref:Uncharacterized protein n=1 Tax=Colletotrichum paranaense TaxID=1914294 RepID=A0ABQ9SF32_9PEZI|nr:uncharacterized protein CPAR01_08835 [Colletotrichum paranaense]KAK1535293.1 hypothetical protein CPAR01_08835 [Colletotrichum paranaense]
MQPNLRKAPWVTVRMFLPADPLVISASANSTVNCGDTADSRNPRLTLSNPYIVFAPRDTYNSSPPPPPSFRLIDRDKEECLQGVVPHTLQSQSQSQSRCQKQSQSQSQLLPSSTNGFRPPPPKTTRPRNGNLTPIRLDSQVLESLLFARLLAASFLSTRLLCPLQSHWQNNIPLITTYETAGPIVGYPAPYFPASESLLSYMPLLLPSFQEIPGNNPGCLLDVRTSSQTQTQSQPNQEEPWPATLNPLSTVDSRQPTAAAAETSNLKQRSGAPHRLTQSGLPGGTPHEYSVQSAAQIYETSRVPYLKPLPGGSHPRTATETLASY